MSDVYDVLVVGAGLAGTTACLRLREAGLTVAVAGRRAGGTALFSGAGQLYGPHRQALPQRSPLRVERGRGGIPEAPARTASERRAMLGERFPEHPFVVAGLDAAALRRDAALAVALGELPLTICHEAVHVLGAGGLRRGADLPMNGVARLSGDDAEGVVVVGLAELPGISAPWLARAAGPGARGVVLSPLGDAVPTTGNPLAVAAAVGRDEGLQEALCKAVASAAAGAQQVILPAVLGLTMEARDALAKRMGEAAGGAEVTEAAAVADSSWGFRLHGVLEARLAGCGAERTAGVMALDEGALGWEAALEDGQSVRAKTVLLAAGGHIGRAAAPAVLRRWLTSSDISARAVEMSPWRDHGFVREGVAVGAALRASGTRWPLLACGAMLAGHDQARDGTALGVALVTGLLAAEEALRVVEGGTR